MTKLLTPSPGFVSDWEAEHCAELAEDEIVVVTMRNPTSSRRICFSLRRGGWAVE